MKLLCLAPYRILLKIKSLSPKTISNQGGGDRLIQDIMTLSTVVGGYMTFFKPVSLKWTNWYKGWYANRKMKNQLVITGQNWTNWHFWWYILQSITHTYWFSQVFLSISSFIIKPAYFRGGGIAALRVVFTSFLPHFASLSRHIVSFFGLW